MRNLGYIIIKKIAQFFKGPEYEIDPDISLGVLVNYCAWYAAGLARSLACGPVVSMDPRKLVFLGPRVELRNRRLITFGHSVTLGKGVVIDGLSKQGIEIGDNVTIGPYTIIDTTGVITNLGEGCRIGARSALGAFSYIGAAGGVWIGKDVIMGQRVSFHAENHIFDRIDIPIRTQGVTRKGISIEDDCWIGANVTFLDGAYVGQGCVIGAGAVVSGSIPPYSVAVGIPARVIKSRKF
jgi:acetyltransferase-like isoleucine patch superfamily enzyme